MNRRTFVKSSSLAVGIGASTGYSFLNFLLNPQSYQISPLRNNVGIFTEQGGTIGWMISDEGVVVVDTQFEAPAQHMIAEIKKHWSKPINLLINTHHHGDHTSGNIAFKGMINQLVAHENSKNNQKRVAKDLNSVLLPDTTYQSGQWSQKVGNETMTLRYFGPGHTDGDSVVHFENANVVHMGDLLFNRRPPYIDKSAGANIANWMLVLEQTYKTFAADTLFVYGHSGEGYKIQGTRDDLKAFSNYLEKSLAYVKKGVEAGKSKEELAKTEIIPGAPEWKGNQSRTIEAAYTELFEETK